MTLRSAFISAVSALLDEDPQLTLLLGDISVYAFRDAFAKHPTRCYNLGICEQASISLASGLSVSGLFPIYHTIAPFMLRRAYEQIYLDFGISKLPGLFVGIGGANDYAKLGETHRMPEEITLASLIPGMRVTQPKTEEAVAVDITRAIRERDLVYVSLEEGRA